MRPGEADLVGRDGAAESEAKLRTVLESTTDSIFMLAPDWRFTFLNRRAIDHVARGRNLLGEIIWKAFPEAVGGPLWQAYHHCMAERVSAEAEQFYEPLGRWFTARAFPAADGGIAVFFRDVTEERRTAARLSKVKGLLRALGEVSSDLLYAKDRQGRMLYANPATLAVLGRSAADVIGRTAAECMIDPAQAKAVMQTDQRVMSGEMAETVEDIMTDAHTGKPRIWQSTKMPLRDPYTREVVGLVGVSRDITEARQAERALAESEARFRNTFEHAAVGVANVGPDGRWLQVNRHLCEMLGYTEAELRSRTFQDLTHPDDLSANLANVHHLLSAETTTYSTEKRYIRKDGSTLWGNLTVSVLRDEMGAPQHFISVIEDISARKFAEAQLAESEARLRLALEAGNLAFWELDVATGKVVRALYHDQVFGYTSPQPEWTFEIFLSHVLLEDHQEVERAYNAALLHPNSVILECRIRRAGDGAIRWIELCGKAHLGSDGQVKCLHGVLRDVTDRKQTQAALRASEARLRSILETLPDAMVVIDERERIESFSAAAERLFGYASEEVIGREISLLLSNAEQPSQAAGPTRIGRAVALGSGGKFAGHRKDNLCFPVELAIGEIEADGNRHLFTCFVRDLSERLATEAHLQDLQAKLLHVSRVSAAGEIASALAHELNQPLTAIASATRAARRWTASLPDTTSGEGRKLREAVDLAAEQALRAGEIVRNLRAFVAPGKTERRPEILPPVIEEAAGLALVDARERKIHSIFQFTPELPPVLANRIQIQQVILNLVRNALEAMLADAPSGTGSSHQHELRIAAAPAGSEMVAVEVADTGPGLAPEIAGRLFEFFASTKSGGMGMGLSISRTIIEAHGGRLWAEPNPGGGAVFRFTLPIASLPDRDAG